MTKNKIETYLGFCLRARKLLLGTDNVEKANRNVYMLLADETLSDNSFKILVKAQEKFSCPLLQCSSGFIGECLHRYGVKAVAVQDKNLADAILEHASNIEEVKLYSGGNN